MRKILYQHLDVDVLYYNNNDIEMEDNVYKVYVQHNRYQTQKQKIQEKCTIYLSLYFNF